MNLIIAILINDMSKLQSSFSKTINFPLLFHREKSLFLKNLIVTCNIIFTLIILTLIIINSNNKVFQNTLQFFSLETIDESVSKK
jgi:hypothetical protein